MNLKLKRLFVATLVAVPLMASAQTYPIAINEESFPDENFRNYLLEQDYGTDGVITEEEIQSITKIDVYNQNIGNLKGIEYFTELTDLWCNNNQLSSLDVSKNTELTQLHCDNNQLSSLDMSQNTKLKWLLCEYNQLSFLDVSKNTILIELNCWGNQLTSLDVSKNTKLTYLNCWGNQLSSLDVSKNTGLTYLSCDNNQLSSLDVSQNTELITLWCGNNQLSFLDVSKNTALTDLSCGGNPLNSLAVSQNIELTTLSCGENQLNSLDVSHNTKLTSLSCDNNQLSSLDVSGCTELTWLSCDNNQLSFLDVSHNTKLTSLYCNDIQLSSLDVSRCTELTFLSCDNNQLSSLDVSGCTLLTLLSCDNNQLSSLNVSGCTELTDLNCSRNQIKGKSMDDLINSLPTNTTDKECRLMITILLGNDGNICTTRQVKMAKDKGWTVTDIAGGEYAGVLETAVIITDAEYTACVTKFDIDFTATDGLTAYKVTEASATSVTLEPITEAPEGTAVILSGEEGTYMLCESPISLSKWHITDNLFMAGGTQQGDGKTIYALGNKSKGVGFYRVAEGVTVPEDKGYLVINTASEAKEFIPFGGEATGIETITEAPTENEAVIYNLAGQRITEPTQNGIYIMNGKKVFINK